MTDVEIFKWLYELEPESDLQKKKIEKMMRIILKKDYYDNSLSTEEFIDTLTIDDVENKTSKEVYENYIQWCRKKGVKPNAKNTFGSSVQEKFNVKSTTVRVNGKVCRVFKSL